MNRILRNKAVICLWAASIVFFAQQQNFAQVLWRCSAESGCLGSNPEAGGVKNDFITRLESRFEYQFQDEAIEGAIRFKARPEFSGIAKSLRSFRGRLAGSYSQTWETSALGISAYAQKHQLYLANNDLLQDVFVIRGDMSFTLSPLLDFNVYTGYGYQIFDSNNKQEIDIFFAGAQWQHQLKDVLKLNYGLYAERFTFSHINHSNQFKLEVREPGFRFGPDIGFRLHDDFLLDMDYKFLFYSSRVTAYPSIEQTIRCVAGKIFNGDISLLLLIDFNWRKLLYKTGTDNYVETVFSPFDQENRLLVKAGYDISESLETYIQCGYIKENALRHNSNFDSWNLIMGLDMSIFD